LLQILFTQIKEVLPLKGNGAASNLRRRLRQEAKKAKGGDCFATSGLTYQTDRLALPHLVTHAINGLCHALISIEIDFQVIND
jgi:hypothetical protein